MPFIVTAVHTAAKTVVRRVSKRLSAGSTETEMAGASTTEQSMVTPDAGKPDLRRQISAFVPRESLDKPHVRPRARRRCHLC